MLTLSHKLFAKISAPSFWPGNSCLIYWSKAVEIAKLDLLHHTQFYHLNSFRVRFLLSARGVLLGSASASRASDDSFWR